MLGALRVVLWFVLRVLLHVAVLALVMLALLLRMESPAGGRPVGYASYMAPPGVRPR
jgi:hypothetical protein